MVLDTPSTTPTSESQKAGPRLRTSTAAHPVRSQEIEDRIYEIPEEDGRREKVWINPDCGLKTRGNASENLAEPGGTFGRRLAQAVRCRLAK